jgi:cation diffusion facilitator CzcD-associated flavoprotein CzcO
VAIPTIMQRALGRIPGLRLILRGSIFLWLELLLSGLTHRRTGLWARALARRHLRRQVADPGLRQRLTPNYPIGCKRVLISSDYYPALQLPQVQLVDTPIEAIVPTGARLVDGRELPLDVLIHATGFRPLDVLSGLEITGREGQRLTDSWAQRPQAHLGISPHGYPNLHFLLGPNTALGHNSVIYMIESQVRHILRLHQLRRASGALSVEATAAAQASWLARVDRAFPASAWAGGCHSWYLDNSGQNIALWTRSCLAYRWLTRRPREGEYRLDRRSGG